MGFVSGFLVAVSQMTSVNNFDNDYSSQGSLAVFEKLRALTTHSYFFVISRLQTSDRLESYAVSFLFGPASKRVEKQDRKHCDKIVIPNC